MSDYASLLSRLRDAEATATRFERALAASPGSRALQLDSLSARRLAHKLEIEFQDAAVDYGVDVLRYRIVPAAGNAFTLESVGNSLLNFQKVFTLIYSALAAGPRKTAHVPRDLEFRSALDFGYTFSGSLGIVLTAEGGKMLFDDKFDETVDVLNDSVDVKNQNEVRQIANNFGPAVVKKLYEWAKTNQESSYSLDLQWQNSHGLKKGRYIEKLDFVRVTDLIGLTSDVSSTKVELSGVFAGGDIITRRFHFIDNNDKDYRGVLHGNFQTEEPALGRRYRAVIQIDTIRRYSSEEDDARYTLVELKDDPRA